MQLTNTITVKEMTNAGAGELILFSMGRVQALGIVLDYRFPNLDLCILRSNISNVLTLYSTRRREVSCVSYGKNWIVEPIIGTETISDNFDLLEKPGILHLDEASVMVYFKGASSEVGPYSDYIDLMSNTHKAPSRSALPVKNWRIWQSHEDMKSGKAEPLFSFNYEANGEPSQGLE
ncbi:hypothetical protein HFO39_06745 [Rhizobium leguminosarum]|uniref:hypothetical protein n=1 Tax=Rhizobium leguminosarum TaxID=384 RepID=UPI001C94C383|nr:hypothetical protein [Rhizobium leguminosarum]MBY5634488.1 hypothetical protein [Rhizobium leguminosarum]